MASMPQLPGFVFTERLGKGSYATVYKAYRKGTLREVVAVKCVQKSSLTKSAVENLLTEISILKKIKHDYIVELKDFQWDNTCIYLIMEYCSGGDLSRFIHRKNRLPEVVVQRFLQQLAKALEVLRTANIAHMDLKPQNILLSCSHNPVLKLADFGFAQYLHPEDEATSLRGSPLYMAPEILLKHHYDARVDLWSVGIILYECLFGQAPFSSTTFSELAEKIKSTKPVQLPYGVEVSDSCRDLVLHLLQRDPEKRITFEEFFNHPFVDLEHMPSPQSYSKGVTLIQQAVREDGKGQYVKAIQLYSAGLQYLVPVVNSEADKPKKEALKTKVVEYIERAEALKTLLKANCDERTTDDEMPLALQQLENSTAMQRALEKAFEADLMAKQEKYEEASRLYSEALEVMVTLVGAEPQGKRKELLYAQVDRWMKKAEDLKSYLLVLKLRKQEVNDSVSRNQGTPLSQSFKDISAGTCCIQ